MLFLKKSLFEGGGAMLFFRKLKKNKLIVLSICVIVVSMVYMGVQNAIDNYNFENNSDIVASDDFDHSSVSGANYKGNGSGNSSSDSGESKEEGTEGAESEIEDESSNSSERVEDVNSDADSSGEISNEETDFVLEEVSEDGKTENGDVSEGETAVGEGDESEDENKIFVYVTGEVNNPGVVILNEGSRIVDAINAAGGTTAKANISKVNLVYVLDDGMKVNIPNSNDLKNNSDFEYITMNSGDGGSDDYFSSGSSASAGSSTGGTGAGAGAGGGSGSSASGSSGSSGSGKRYDIVNINTASQTELETLPGIGPSLALKIINYRKENGRFSSIEQIKDVSGIGDSKFESLKAYITV